MPQLRSLLGFGGVGVTGFRGSEAQGLGSRVWGGLGV